MTIFRCPKNIVIIVTGPSLIRLLHTAESLILQRFSAHSPLRMTMGDDSDDDSESTIVTVTLARHTAGWEAVSRIIRRSPVREVS